MVPADGAYSLKPSSFLDFKLSYAGLEGKDDSFAFSVPFARIALKGTLFTKTFKYNVTTDFAKGNAVLTYYFGDYAVVPDYYAKFPKPCMGGWGRGIINITPSGRVLPCHAAESIAGMTFPNVRDTSLRSAWEDSEAFNRFRGTGWMPEPCRGCDRAERDWGGCRCQAFALTGDAAATDPACALSPHHDLLAVALAEAGAPAFRYREFS